MKHAQQCTKGFTFIELVIVIGVTLIVSTFSLQFYYNQNVNSDFNNVANELRQNLRIAQSLAMASQDNRAYGIKVNYSDYVLFAGSSYATRDTSFDLTITLPTFISLSGLSEVVFVKTFGTTTQTGDIIINNANTGQTVTLTLNSEGIVQ